jgi:hypothetical protein
MGSDQVGVDAPCDERLKRRPGLRGTERIEAPIIEVRDPGREPEPRAPRSRRGKNWRCSRTANGTDGSAAASRSAKSPLTRQTGPRGAIRRRRRGRGRESDFGSPEPG